MTHDPTDSHPLDLRDLQAADGLGRAWDAWLRDDLEPTRHTASQSLAAGLAATVEDIYDTDDTPGPSAAFRRGLKRDLLHVHDAMRLHPALAPDSDNAPPTFIPPVTSIPAPEESKRRFRGRPSRPTRRWWPAVEFAAATIVIAALFGITFGNARIAEFFRDDNGNFASNGNSLPSVFLEQGWINEIRDDLELGLRPERITVTDGIVAVISSDSQSQTITLTVFNASDGVRIWTADVSEGFFEGVQGRDSAPVIADGRLYFLNRAGFLYAFDIATYPEPEGLLYSAPLPFSATASDLVLLDGIVYATGGDADGTDWSLPDLTEIDGSLFVAGDTSDRVVGIDIDTGRFILELMSLPTGPSVGPKALWQIDPKGGTIAGYWQEPNLVATNVAALESGLLVVTYTSPDGASNVVTIVDPHDIGSELLRSFKTDQGLHGEGIIAGDTMILTISDPETSLAMYVLDPDIAEETPRLFWDYTNVRNKPDPIVGGDTSVVVSDNDVLRVYDPSTGAILGQTPIGTGFGEVNAIDVVEDVIYVAFESGTVARFDQIPADAAPLPAPASTPTAWNALPPSQAPNTP